MHIAIILHLILLMTLDSIDCLLTYTFPFSVYALWLAVLYYAIPLFLIGMPVFIYAFVLYIHFSSSTTRA